MDDIATDVTAQPDHDDGAPGRFPVPARTVGRRGALLGAMVTVGAACTVPATTPPASPPPPRPAPTGPSPGGAPPTTPPTTAPPTTAPPTSAPPSGPPPTAEQVAAARHLAQRATFGATAADVDRILRLGPAAWVAEQLDPASDLADAEGLLSQFPTLTNSDAQNEQVLKSDSNDLLAQLDHATLLRAVHSQRQLHEVMCDFWTNHLNVWRRSSWMLHLKTGDNERVVRPHALGRFADLLAASTRSAAMLGYLDNHTSNGSPGNQVNENYGRELLELHTLGIVDGEQVYSEEDVVGVAKVLSGWAFSWAAGPGKFGFQFNQWAHSHDAVSILGGAWSRPERADYQDRVANAQADGESLVDFLAHHPSTARHLAWKLARRFVADDPPAALVDHLADVYLANDTSIAAVLTALFASPEFAASAGAKVKRPIDWLYSSLRVTGASIATAPRGNAANKLRLAGAALGQPLFERPSPDGWPDTGPAWMSAEGLLTRWRAAAAIARNTLAPPDRADPVLVDIAAMLPTEDQPDVAAVLVWIAEHRCQFALPGADVAALCQGLQLPPDAPADELTGDEQRLRNAVAVLLAHPSFQHR